MIIETPQPSVYSAAPLMGTLNKEGGPLGMAVVMKAAYNLVADGDDPWQMDAVVDPTRSAIVMADRGITRFTAPGINRRIISPQNYKIQNGDQVLVVDGRGFSLKKIKNDEHMKIDFDLTYEADTALAKAHADIVVLGRFIPPSGQGAVVVNDKTGDKTWLTRSPPLPDTSDADMTRNLFGFEPRQGTAREGERKSFRDFASMHRRKSAVFEDKITHSQLPSGGLVKIYRRTDTAGEPDYALRLPDLDQGIRLRVYCGHGPDAAPRWRKVNLGLMRPDTLIVDPSEDQAAILWRHDWPADLEPTDRYRKVQIRAGGF